MDLQALKFKVDTSELATAVTALNNLGQAVSKVNTPIKETAKATEQSTKATKENVTILERQQDILKFMTEGYSKGQASVLAYAKASGALAGDIDLLGKTLKTQRTLMGTDPFDKSAGALQTLQNEYKKVTEVQNLYNQNLGLTKGQMETLAREKQRLIALYEIEGKDVKNLEAEYGVLVQEATKIAQAENAIATSMRNKEKVTNDAAKANAYLEKEMRRVDSALKDTNKELSSGANNALLRFEAALKNSGKTAAQQTIELEAYRVKLLQVNKASGDRQVNYLARALGPQITDIGVGLLTGQNPMTVLLQQGGQLRDQFALAGVAGKDMGKMLTEAAANMVTSIKDVALAVGGLLVNSIKNVAVAVSGGIFTLFVDGFKAMVLGGEAAAASLERLKLAAIGLGKVGLVTLVATLAALGKGFYDTFVQSDHLVKQLTLAGGSLGLTKDSAIAYASAMNVAGVSTYKALDVIAAMSKEGHFLASQIPMVSKAAVDMQTYAGIAIEDTVKAFAKMKEKPVESLRELAISTGMVAPEVVKVVYQLEQQGKAAEASALAMKTLAETNTKQVNQMKEDYSGFAVFVKELSQGISNFFDKTFRDLWYKASPTEALKKQIAEIDRDIKTGVDQFGVGEEGLKAQKFQLEQQLAVMEKKAVLDSEAIAKQSENNKLLKEFQHDQEQFALNKQKREKEIAEATVRDQKLIAAGLITQAQHEQVIANIRKKYKDEPRTLTFFETEIQNAQKMTAIYEDAQYTMNEAQKRMVSLAVDPRFLEESQKNQQKIMQQLVKASNEINEKSRVQYGKKENLALDKETRALHEQADALGLTDAARIKAAASAEALNKRLEEEDYINKQAWSNDDKKLEKMAAVERYNQRVANGDVAVANMLKAERINAYGAAFENVFNGMADAITNFVTTGQLSFKGLIDGMLTDLIRFEMRAQSMAIYRAIGGTSGIMGMITGKSATAPDNIDVGGGWSPAANALGGAYAGGVKMFAQGGTFTNSIVDSPTLFKFAKGTGMMGEAGPEAIMPLRRGADGSLGVQAQGGGSNVQVSVINNTTAQATTQETTDSKGNRKVEVIIGDMTASEMSRNGSSSQKALKSTFGLQPALIRR